MPLRTSHSTARAGLVLAIASSLSGGGLVAQSTPTGCLEDFHQSPLSTTCPTCVSTNPQYECPGGATPPAGYSEGECTAFGRSNPDAYCEYYANQSCGDQYDCTTNMYIYLCSTTKEFARTTVGTSGSDPDRPGSITP